MEMIKDKETYDPSKVSDKVLLDDHRISHAWWGTILQDKKVKGWSKEDVHNVHKLIANEMTKRKLGLKAGKHASPLPTNSIHQTPNSTLSHADGSPHRQLYDPPPRASDIHGELAVHGEMLALNTVLDVFTGDFMIAEDFVSIVGGLCNHGQTKGDVDILLKCPEPKSERSPLGMATKFRIARALAKAGVDEDRLQFLYDEFSGPFTNHAHLYDLVLRLKPKRELHQMSEAILAVVKPFSIVTQPKPIHGRFKEEIYSPETVAKVVEGSKKWKEALPNGILVERKFDGVRCQVHKVGSKIEIFTEEKTNVTKKLPTLAKEFGKNKHNFVAEFESELWLDDKHQNRADTAAVLHVKGIHESESEVVANCYDLLWLNGKDIHSSDFSERHKSLQAVFPTTEKIKPSKAKLVKSTEELKKEVSSASNLPGSEGAMIKLPTYKYPLTAHTSDMIKFKREESINVQVVEVHQVEGSAAKNYLTAIRDGRKLIPAGRTYNTNISVNVGDSLEVVFVELSKYIDPKTKDVWYNFWSPRVVEKTGKADSAATAEKLVEKTGGQVAEKAFPSRYKNLLEEEEEDYVDSFLSNALLWDSEEFDFALSNGWISPNTIPETLSQTDFPDLRNESSFLLKKSLNDRAIICLRNPNNKIEAEQTASLVEVQNGC